MTEKWHEDRFHLSFLNKKQKILANVLFFLYLRTLPWLCQFPRSYFRIMQPILQHARKIVKK